MSRANLTSFSILLEKNWKASVLLEDADNLSPRDAVFCSYGSMLYVCRILGGLGT